MAKKLLCVIISVLMVVAMLPVGAFADDVDTSNWQLAFNGFDTGWNGWSGVNGSAGATEFSATVADLMTANGIDDITSFGGFQAQIWSLSSTDEGATYDYVIYVDDVEQWSGSATVALNEYNATSILQVANVAGFGWGDYTFTGDETVKVVISNVQAAVVEEESGEEENPSEGETTTDGYTVISSQTSEGNLTCLDAEGVDVESSTQYLCIYYTYDAADDSYNGYGPCALTNGDWQTVIGYGTSYNDILVITAEDGCIKVPLTTIYTIYSEAGIPFNGENVILNWWADDASSGAYASLVKVEIIDTSVTTGGETGGETGSEEGGETGGETETTTSSATRASGLIYVNEEYHGFLIVRNGTKHLACVPHTVDANGYCTVCKEYIGVDGDAATTEINGGEYVEAYSEDILFTSSGWGTYDLGDTALIDALSVEGSILVITRDRETSITFDDNSYEKFGLVDSWWSGDWMQLGTGGHTDADEESATIIDCISDDGVSVMYDGNTIYDAWVAAGMSNGGTATLITNTSGLYQITNVTVYVPAGSTTVEEVEVTEPQESTDTETEEDGTDDVDVSETGTDDTTADVAESNPTTGVVIALVPMAIAGLAVVASKRR